MTKKYLYLPLLLIAPLLFCHCDDDRVFPGASSHTVYRGHQGRRFEIPVPRRQPVLRPQKVLKWDSQRGWLSPWRTPWVYSTCGRGYFGYGYRTPARFVSYYRPWYPRLVYRPRLLWGAQFIVPLNYLAQRLSVSLNHTLNRCAHGVEIARGYCDQCYGSHNQGRAVAYNRLANTLDDLSYSYLSEKDDLSDTFLTKAHATLEELPGSHASQLRGLLPPPGSQADDFFGEALLTARVTLDKMRFGWLTE